MKLHEDDAQQLGIVASITIHAIFLLLFFMLPSARMMPIKTFYISFEQQEASVKDTQEFVPPASKQEVVPVQPQQRNETVESITEQKPVTPITQTADVINLTKVETQKPVSTGITGLQKTGSPPIVETYIGNANAPAFIHREMPVYPRMARRLGIEGKVVLKLWIDMAGTLQNIEVIEAAGHGFVEAAVTAVRKSSFTPARWNGEKIASKAILSVRFNLE